MLQTKIFRYVFLIILVPLSLYARVTPCDSVMDGIPIKGTCKGILKHGKFVGYYPNGMLAWEIHYKDGKLHGKFHHFRINGSPHFSGSYKNGALHGAFTQYAKDDKTLKTHFKKGVLHDWLYTFKGREKTKAYQYYYGKLVAQKYFD